MWAGERVPQWGVVNASMAYSSATTTQTSLQPQTRLQWGTGPALQTLWTFGHHAHAAGCAPGQVQVSTETAPTAKWLPRSPRGMDRQSTVPDESTAGSLSQAAVSSDPHVGIHAPERATAHPAQGHHGEPRLMVPQAAAGPWRSATHRALGDPAAGPRPPTDPEAGGPAHLYQGTAANASSGSLAPRRQGQ